jgi:hypothetical protein
MTPKEIQYKSESLIIYRDGTSVSLKQRAPSPDEHAPRPHRPMAGQTPGSVRMAESRQQRRAQQETINLDAEKEMLANSKTRLGFSNFNRFVLMSKLDYKI